MHILPEQRLLTTIQLCDVIRREFLDPEAEYLDRLKIDRTNNTIDLDEASEIIDELDAKAKSIPGAPTIRSAFITPMVRSLAYKDNVDNAGINWVTPSLTHDGASRDGWGGFKVCRYDKAGNPKEAQWSPSILDALEIKTRPKSLRITWNEALTKFKADVTLPKRATVAGFHKSNLESWRDVMDYIKVIEAKVDSNGEMLRFILDKVGEQ